MKTYAISTALLKGFSLDEAIAGIAEAGFHEAELSGDEGHLDNWIADPARTRRLLESAGIVARSVHSPVAGWDNATPDEAARRASMEVVATCFLHAAEVGAEMVIYHPNKLSDSFTLTLEEYEATWARSRESLVILAERARAANVKMAVENLSAKGQPRPGATMTDLLKMIDGLGDHVGICLDAGHSHLSGICATDEVIEAGERLLALHIQDNDGNGEDQHLLPGRGTIDWDAFLDALDKINFKGLRTFEVLKKNAEVETLLQALAALRQEWEAH